jgi:uncharacterized protein
MEVGSIQTMFQILLGIGLKVSTKEMQRFLVRLANSRKYTPQDTSSLTREYQDAVKGFGSSVKNVRVSEIAVEFDLFSANSDSREKSLEVLLKHGPLLTERNLSDIQTVRRSKENVVNSSIDLFNEQRYWECHESMEEIWRLEPNPEEKAVQQGLILAASALVHVQRNEYEVCLGMFPRTLEKLKKWKGGKYYSFDPAKLIEALNRILDTKKIEFPKL